MALSFSRDINKVEKINSTMADSKIEVGQKVWDW